MILKLGYVLTYNGKLNCALNYMHVGGLTILIIVPLTLHCTICYGMNTLVIVYNRAKLT